VDEFMQNAERLLDGARAVASVEPASSEVAILIGRDGSIRTVSSPDWPLESLALKYGARLAYRVSRNRGRVRVEGRADCRRCVLEAEPRGFETGFPALNLGRVQPAPPSAALAAYSPIFDRMSFT
jgi:hypothetical protein